MKVGYAMMIVAVLCALLPTVARASQLYVPSEHATVADAVAAAANGDTISIAPGTYFENLYIEKYITLIGPSGPDMTTIASASPSSAVLCFADGNMAPGLGWTVAGLTISGGYTGIDSSAAPGNGDLEVHSCIIEGASAYGVHTGGPRLVLVETEVLDCGDSCVHLGGYEGTGSPHVVTDCLISGSGLNGIRVSGDATEFEIIGNTVIANYDGIRVSRPFGAGTGIISSNLIAENERWGLIISQISEYDCSQVAYNDIWGNGSSNIGPGLCEDDSIAQYGNISEDPLYCDELPGNRYIAEESPCIGAGEGGANIGAFGVACSAGTYVVEDAHSWGQIKALYR